MTLILCRSPPVYNQEDAGAHFRADNEDDFGFVGTPPQIVEQMRSFIALGVDYFMVDCAGFPDLTTLELLVHEVLPTLNG